MLLTYRYSDDFKSNLHMIFSKHNTDNNNNGFNAMQFKSRK